LGAGLDHFGSMRKSRRPDSSGSQGTFTTSPRQARPGYISSAAAQSSSLGFTPTAQNAHTSLRRRRLRVDDRLYELESDLGPETPVTPGELDALVLLLGSDLDSFLSGKD
jgi:hypothetical protein